MTIEEHFLWMIVLEFGIFFIGVGLIVWQQRKQTNLIESVIYNPDYAGAVAENMIFKFMESVSNDKKKQEAFFGFMSVLTANAIAGAKNYLTGPDGTPQIKFRRGSVFKPFEDLLNIPAIQSKLVSKINQVVEGKAAEAVEKAAEGWG